MSDVRIEAERICAGLGQWLRHHVACELHRMSKVITGGIVSMTAEERSALRCSCGLDAALASQQEEHARLTARAVVAEQHKVMSLLGKSSWQEVVEDKLRIDLAEAQVALAAALAEVERLTRINVTVNGLAMYARHKDDCPATFTENARVDREPDVCNCGLAALAAAPPQGD